MPDCSTCAVPLLRETSEFFLMTVLHGATPVQNESTTLTHGPLLGDLQIRVAIVTTKYSIVISCPLPT
jgi:hypothetical protein